LLFSGAETPSLDGTISPRMRGMDLQQQFRIFLTKKDLSIGQTTRKAKEPDNFKGNPEDVNA